MPGVKIPGKIGMASKFGQPKEEEPAPRPKIKKIKSIKKVEPKAGQLPAPEPAKPVSPKTTRAKKVDKEPEEKKAAAAAPAPAKAPEVKKAEAPKPAAAAPAAQKPMPKKPKAKKKKATSSVFSQFEQAQIQEFKEAFQMIDQDRNGIIDVGDLKATYAALGVRHNDPDALKAMIAEADGATINFTVFLNMLADKLHGTDPEDVILKAFKVYDPENKGVMSMDSLKSCLMQQADRFSEEEFQSIIPLLSIDGSNQVDYKALCYTLCHGNNEEDEE